MKKKIIISSIFVAVVAVAVAVVLLVSRSQKQKNNYTVADVKAKIGQKVSKREFEIGGQECINLWCTNRSETSAQRAEYYIFEDAKAAKKAFEEMSNKWIGSVTDEGKDYIQGWENGVCDASVEIFIYVHNNMIITADLQIVGEWAEPVDGPSENSVVTHYEVKDYIMSTWND